MSDIKEIEEPGLGAEEAKAREYTTLVVLPHIGDIIAYQHGLHFCQETRKKKQLQEHKQEGHSCCLTSRF
ncbi:MAG: hypothetical protein WAM14_12420 [Candidatus Nitrosopolaris sp.]